MSSCDLHEVINIQKQILVNYVMCCVMTRRSVTDSMLYYRMEVTLSSVITLMGEMSEIRNFSSKAYEQLS